MATPQNPFDIKDSAAAPKFVSGPGAGLVAGAQGNSNAQPLGMAYTAEAARAGGYMTPNGWVPTYSNGYMDPTKGWQSLDGSPAPAAAATWYNGQASKPAADHWSNYGTEPGAAVQRWAAAPGSVP